MLLRLEEPEGGRKAGFRATYLGVVVGHCEGCMWWLKEGLVGDEGQEDEGNGNETGYMKILEDGG